MADAKWYVIHTYSGYENKVASNLQLMVDNRGIQDLIQEIYVPTEQVTEIKDDKKRVVPTGKRVADGFSYSSDNNTEWLTVEQIKELIKTVDLEK